MARDAKGRWLPGTSGNPKGGPRFAIQAEYAGLLNTLITPEDIEEIIRTALARAKAGDRHARAWLFNYLWGKPVERVIAATGDVDLEWVEGEGEDQGTEPAS